MLDALRAKAAQRAGRDDEAMINYYRANAARILPAGRASQAAAADRPRPFLVVCGASNRDPFLDASAWRRPAAGHVGPDVTRSSVCRRAHVGHWVPPSRTPTASTARIAAWMAPRVSPAPA